MAVRSGGRLRKPPMRSAGGTYRRELSFFSLLAMSLGTVIGSGWLLLPVIVASRAGPAGIVSWAISGAAVLVVAMVYAELGAAWPAPGAVARYPYLSHGVFTGHIAGWAAFVSYAIIPPVEAVAVTRYAGSLAPALVTRSSDLTALGMLVAVATLAGISLLNYVGVKYLAAFERWVTIVKYIPILVFLGAVAALAFRPENFTAYGGFAPAGASGVLLGTAGTLFAFLGFRQALAFSGEARNPGRDLPRVLLWTIVLATATYGLIAVVVTGGLNWAGLARFGVVRGDWASLAGLPAPLYNVTQAAGLAAVAWLIFADGVISPNGPNATNVGAVPRVAYEVARGGTLPRFFLRLSPRYGTPGLGLLASLALEVFFLLVTAGGYGQLTAAVNVAFMVAYAVGPVAMGTLRRTAPDVPRPFRLSGAGFWAPLAFILSSLLLYWSQWPLTGEVLGVVFVGILIYGAYVLFGGVGTETVAHGTWLVVYLLAMAAISYAGDRRFGGRGLLPFGWDIAVVTAAALLLYAWGIREGMPYRGSDPAS